MGPKTKRKIVSHLIEFFFVGLLMGVIEDLLAIHFATDAKISFEVVKVAFLVAFPFAFLSEILVDYGILRRLWWRKKKESQIP